MANIPAGWYPSPDGAPGVRYWNGSEWETAWLEKAPDAHTGRAKAGTTNGLAIASMVLGILWLYWVGSVLAIIFGAIALKQIQRRGQSGRGMAIAGLVLGIVGAATFLLLVSIGPGSSTLSYSTY